MFCLPLGGGLHHPVDGAVAMGGQKRPGESKGQLAEDFGFLVDPEILPVGLLPEDGVFGGLFWACLFFFLEGIDFPDVPDFPEGLDDPDHPGFPENL